MTATDRRGNGPRAEALPVPALDDDGYRCRELADHARAIGSHWPLDLLACSGYLDPPRERWPFELFVHRHMAQSRSAWAGPGVVMITPPVV